MVELESSRDDARRSRSSVSLTRAGEVKGEWCLGAGWARGRKEEERRKEETKPSEGCAMDMLAETRASRARDGKRVEEKAKGPEESDFL